MIQFQYKDDKDNTLVCTCPHSWGELSFAQLVKIESAREQQNGLINLFSIITGIEFQLIADTTDEKLIKTLQDVCAFIADSPVWENVKCPEKIELGLKTYKVPTDIGKLMHGQVELLTQVGKDKNLLDEMAYAISVVLQPHVDGEGKDGKLHYDGQSAEKIKQLVYKARGVDVYGMGMFFFQKFAPIFSIGINNMKQYQSQRMRKRSYYTDWLKLRDFTVLPV